MESRELDASLVNCPEDIQNRTGKACPTCSMPLRLPQGWGSPATRAVSARQKHCFHIPVTLYKGRVIVIGCWRLINISCFENKLLGLALTLIYHQRPIISRPMFCSIDLLDFFLPKIREYNCISPSSISTNCSLHMCLSPHGDMTVSFPGRLS